MIHQFIFAAPKPRMSEAAFQDYWVNVHARQYAAKIPQIRRYLVNTRVPHRGDPPKPMFGGVAEIWFKNEQEQLASLQTIEFLQGARIDEPRWAAFWQTLVVNTIDLEFPIPDEGDSAQTGFKFVALLKRREGMTLMDFRERLSAHASEVLRLPNLRRYVLCYSQDGAYVTGEAPFDCVLQLWFDDVASLEAALASKAYVEHAYPKLQALIEPKYWFSFALKEHMIIGPDFRPDPEADMTPTMAFYREHMKYIAAKDIAGMVNETYADDAILYHTFPYFPGTPPYVHHGKWEIIEAHRIIFAPENHGAIVPEGDVFNFMEGEAGVSSLFFQLKVRSPNRGLFLNSDFWIIENGKMKHQFVTGVHIGD